jgi:hypothetical protein
MMGRANVGTASERVSQWWVPLESLLATWTLYQDRWVVPAALRCWLLAASCWLLAAATARALG